MYDFLYYYIFVGAIIKCEILHDYFHHPAEVSMTLSKTQLLVENFRLHGKPNECDSIAMYCSPLSALSFIWSYYFYFLILVIQHDYPLESVFPSKKYLGGERILNLCTKSIIIEECTNLSFYLGSFFIASPGFPLV